MAPLVDFLTYHLEVEWLLTWFPVRSTATLKEAKIRGGKIGHKSTHETFKVGNRVGTFVGQGAGDGDPLAHNNLVRAFITVGVNSAGLFEADLQVDIGRSSRTKRLILRPDTSTPFMINVAAREEDPVIKDTAAAFQGVFTAGHRFGLLDLAVRVVGP